MTLLELLVKELPSRGGWPEGAFECFVHTDIEEIGYFYDENGGGGFGEINTTSVKHVETQSDPVGGCSVTREQYEAALQPDRNGEGLPPVGCECEYIGNDTSWGVVKVIGYDEGRVVFKPSGEDYYGITPSDKSVFRPIRTEAERKRDAAIESLLSLDVFTRPVAEKTIDAIAAGKIPGVEITK